MAKLYFENGQFMLDQENGTEPLVCKEWLETSKPSKDHPEGKPQIVLPKGNITNRRYITVDTFNREAVDGVMEVAIKTDGPRVLGATGVKESVIKYLSEEDATEYRTLVEGAVAAYKEAKGSSKAKKPEDMSVEELEAYVAALKSGVKPTTVKTGPKSFIDMFTDVEYDRYNELLAKSVENKANMPRAARGPLTDEQKQARAAKRVAGQISKAEALLAALKAKSNRNVDDLADIIDEE